MFNISVKDLLANDPDKFAAAINQDTPSGLRTSGSKYGDGTGGLNVTMFNLSEVLQGVATFTSPAEVLGKFESIVGGTIGGISGDEEDDISMLLPNDVAARINSLGLNPFGSDGDTGSGESGGSSNENGDGASPSGAGIPSNIKAITAQGARVVRAAGFDGVIHGYANRDGGHGRGLALDIMTGDNTAGYAMGDKVVDLLLHNRDELQLGYVIWKQRITNRQRREDNWEGGGPVKWRRMAGRGSRTADHWDHPHVEWHADHTPKKEDSLTLYWPGGNPLRGFGASRNSGGGSGGDSLVQ